MGLSIYCATHSRAKKHSINYQTTPNPLYGTRSDGGPRGIILFECYQCFTGHSFSSLFALLLLDKTKLITGPVNGVGAAPRLRGSGINPTFPSSRWAHWAHMFLKVNLQAASELFFQVQILENRIKKMREVSIVMKLQNTEIYRVFF